jgi:hypothetical protein
MPHIYISTLPEDENTSSLEGRHVTPIKYLCAEIIVGGSYYFLQLQIIIYCMVNDVLLKIIHRLWWISFNDS